MRTCARPAVWKFGHAVESIGSSTTLGGFNCNEIRQGPRQDIFSSPLLKVLTICRGLKMTHIDKTRTMLKGSSPCTLQPRVSGPLMKLRHQHSGIQKGSTTRTEKRNRLTTFCFLGNLNVGSSHKLSLNVGSSRLTSILKYTTDNPRTVHDQDESQSQIGLPSLLLVESRVGN